MKACFLRICALLLALLCAASTLCACAGSTLSLIKDGESDHQIVYEKGNSQAQSAATYLAKELEKRMGAVLSVVSDDEAEPDKKAAEICVGQTNRGLDYAAQRTLRANSYRIAREKKRIYILGDGEGTLTSACKAFLTDVLDDEGKVSGKGTLLAREGRYVVDSVTLNDKPISDYTLLSPQKNDVVAWDACVLALKEQLSLQTGFLFNTATYTDAAALPYHPAIVLSNETAGLGEAEYSIELSGEDIILRAGSQKAAMAVAIAIMGQMTAIVEKAVQMELKAGSTKADLQAAIPLTQGASVRVMSFNIFGDDKHKAMMPYVSAAAMAYGADFICMQEFYEYAYSTVEKDLRASGYETVATTLNEVSPTALAKNDAKYTAQNKTCYTPIFYRADIWEPVESGAYLFYWKSRYHASNTKSIAYGVFRNKADGTLISVISTHLPLMTDGYETKDGIPYSSYTDQKEGARWRSEAVQEILMQIELLRAKYPGILTVVGGDMNADSLENSMKTMTDHAVMENAYILAPDAAKTAGGSYHDYGKVPNDTRTFIDHWFVSDDVANVLCHRIVQDGLTLQGSDHCPVVIDIARK